MTVELGVRAEGREHREQLGLTAVRRSFERVREGEVWRLVTPIFLHFGVVHLLLWRRSGSCGV